MAKIIETCVIYIDTMTRDLHYYSTTDGDRNRIIHEIRPIKGHIFSDDYFENMTNTLKEWTEKYSPLVTPNGVFILPDRNVFTNTTSFPSLKGAELNKSIDAYLNNQYKNRNNLKIEKSTGYTSKQYTTINFTGVLNDLVFKIRNACLAARISCQVVSFASCSSQTAFQLFNPKEKVGSYFFVDLKDNFTRMTYVFKGKVVGFYELPFGYSILSPDKIQSEDVLLYRPVSELAVVNAKEKAKQKALTLAGQSNVTDAANDMAEEDESLMNTIDTPELNMANSNIIKTLPKKTARKLPKFMQREVPQEEELRVYENFRIFEKWVLDILNDNDKITSMGRISNVYVNMPTEFDYLFDIINKEEEENGVKFVSAGLVKEKEEISRNLEMYGGFLIRGNANATKF